MKKFIIFPVLLIIVFCSNTLGQVPQERLKKIEQLEKVKLMDLLDLNEETSIKFFSRRNNYTEKRRDLLYKIDSLYHLINRNTKTKSENKISEKEMKKCIDEYLAGEKSLNNLRIEYLNSIKSILNTEQLAKVIVFDRRFKEELRDLVIKRRQKRNK